LCDPNGGAAVDVTRGDAWKAFPHWLHRHLAAVGHASRKEVVPDVGGGLEPCRGLVMPIGVNADGGLVAVACDRSDFPSEADQLLLSVAANHAATAFQSARLVHERRRAEEELRQARDGLELKVTERAGELRQTSAELQTILDASPVGIVLFGRDQTVRRCNAAFERLVGWTADEIVGRRLRLPESIEKRWTSLVARLNRGERLSGLEIRITRKDGSEFDAALACAPFTDERGGPAGFVANIEDISDRKRAEEALRRSEAYLAEAQRLSHTGSWARDIVTNQYTHPSDEYARMFGFDPQRDRPSRAEFLESMDWVNRAMQGTNDLEQMMSDVLDVVLSVFNCDRAWLVHPCDPDAVSWNVPMEHTRPEFPGAFALGRDLPVDSEIANVFQ